MNMEYIRKNKKFLTKEILDNSNNERKKINNILNNEIIIQETDIREKLMERKNRACSLPHQKIEPRKLNNGNCKFMKNT